MKLNRHWLKMRSCVFPIFFLLSSFSQAAVVMTGTRVIFPANQTDKTIQLHNKDKTPNIVQVWLDRGNENSTPDTADAPFIIHPPIFKMAPLQGQTLRLIFTGKKQDFPENKETLFFLNFSEIPASKAEQTDKNKLMVIFKNRVKVFYRPMNLPYPAHEMAKHIHYKFLENGAQVNIINASPYYANIADIHILQNGKKLLLTKNSMIEPFNSKSYAIPSAYIHKNNAINLTLLNDYGISKAQDIQPVARLSDD